MLAGCGVDPETKEAIADENAPLFGSTRKFVSFLMKYRPQAPVQRPHESAQLDWSEAQLKKAITKVYDLRSKAIHSGIPFPPLISEPPFRHAEWDAHEEKPSALGASGMGGTWVKEDLPMHLHMFAQIARRAMMSWGDSLVQQLWTRNQT